MLIALAAAGLFIWTPVALVAQNAPPSRGEEEKLIAVLKSDAKIFDKAKACQRLAVVGSEKAVPVLAGLLSDEKLAHYARFGLEPIPHASVDEALRRAMEKLEGKLKVGVINSIGARRDAGAVAALTGLMETGSPEVAAAAAAALGRIGTSRAAGALQKALAGSNAALRAAAADAAFPCAESLMAQKKPDEAVALYAGVRKARVPKYVMLAGLRGEILARKEGGLPLLGRALGGKDYDRFAMALKTAQEMPGSEVTGILVKQLGKVPPERQPLVIQALGARGDAVALPAVLEAAGGGPEGIRIAAVRALGGLGNAAAVPVLLKAASGSEEELAQAARASLASLEGKEVDDAIVSLLDGSRGGQRALLIELVGARRIASAVPALRRAAEDQDEKTRLAAIQALGQTIGLENLDVLTGRLTGSGTPAEKEAVQEALMAACGRIPDRDACVEKLQGSLSRASADARCLLPGVLNSVGGARALQAVAASARDKDEKIRDAATRALGEWKSEDAAGELLKLIEDSGSNQDRARAFHAFSNLIRRLGFPKEERLARCQEGMNLARRVEEQKIVLHAFAGIPAPETLALLTPYLSNPDLKDDASRAAITISQRIVRSRRRAVQQAMKKVLEATDNEDLVKEARKLYQQAGGR